jgi:hypothetical protein
MLMLMFMLALILSADSDRCRHRYMTLGRGRLGGASIQSRGQSWIQAENDTDTREGVARFRPGCDWHGMDNECINDNKVCMLSRL